MKSKRTPSHNLDEIVPILIGAWRRLHKEAGPSDKLQTREFRRVVEAIKTMQKGFEESQEFDYFSDKELLGAYLLYHWIVHYQQGLSILGEIPRKPNRVLDLCSGPGAFAMAALKHGAGDVTAADRNLPALQQAAEIAGRSAHTLNIRHWNAHKNVLPMEGTFDVIILGHCLLELFPKSKRHYLEEQLEFLAMLFNHLSTDGYLVIVDSPYLEANRRILHLRDRLVEKGIPIQAPCIWRGNCPALQTKNSPCYAQREFYKPYLLKEIQRSAEINLSSLKMSYLILRHPQASWPQLDEKRYYRVVSPPIEMANTSRFYLCGVDGNKNIGTRLNIIPEEAKAYNYLKRGDLISVDGIQENQNALTLVESTKLKLAATCHKPLPESTNQLDE